MNLRHQFGSSFYNTTLKKIIKIEMLSFFGRLFSKNKYLTQKKYLHLGCGDNIKDKNFLHCDFYNFEFFKKIFKKKKILHLDLRYKLPFNSHQFEAVFSEHTIEHLYPSEVKNLFKEIYRVLKPGGIFRVIVPDLKKYIDYYNNKNINLGHNFKSGCEAIWNISSNYEHKSLWDAEWLILNLKENNFQDVKEFGYKNSQLIDLVLDKEGRQVESIYIEAKK